MTYIDKFIIISKWALCLHHFEYLEDREGLTETNKRVGLFVQNFLRYYNISWMEYGTDVILDSFTKERIDI